MYDVPAKSEVITAQHRFFIEAGACAATIITIHWLPKQVPDPVRFAYTVVYFAALLYGLYLAVGPLNAYLRLMFAWRYEHAPDSISRACRSLVFSIGQLIAVPGYLLLAFIGSIALMTLAAWFTDLQVFRPLYNSVWWISLIGFILFPFAGGFLFHEVAQKYRALRHETELSRSFAPRPLAELGARDVPASDAAFEIRDGLKFSAGGMTWHWDDFVQNCAVFGQIGSGKTSCVLNAILDGLLGSAVRAGHRPSGLVLDPKGTFYADVKTLCLKYHLGDDLLVIDPAAPDSLCWNPFDSDDDEYELASRFAAVSRSLGMKDTNSSFWITKSTMFIQYALELIRLTNPAGVPPSFAQINEVASGMAGIADRTDRLDPADPRAHECLSFFATEWATMAAETRSSIQAHLTGMLFPFLKQPYATRFAGRSTMRVADIIDSGKILYLHMPTADRETMARTIGIFLKLEFYREVLKRPRKERPSFFFCDEFQKFFTAGSKGDRDQERSDADTFRLSRESFHANLVATQNVGALGDPETARAFLGNCLTGIFLRNPDDETNQFAARLFSQEIMAIGGAAHAGGAGRLKPMGGQQISSHDQLTDRCPAYKFRELAICSREQSDPHAESIVFLGGRGANPIPIHRLKWKRHPLS